MAVEREQTHLSFLSVPTGDSAIDADLQYLRNLDWANTAAGLMATWPRELLLLVHIAMLSPQPQLFLLGSDSVVLYNTAYGRLLHDHHPLYQGRPLSLNTALLQRQPAFGGIEKHTRESLGSVDGEQSPFFFSRHGRPEEVFLSITMTHLPPFLACLHATAYDVTRDALRSRRENSLDQIRRACECALDMDTLWPSILSGISNGDGDISFAALYRAEMSHGRVWKTASLGQQVNSSSFTLCGTVGSFPTATPSKLEPNIDQQWVKSFFECVDSHDLVLLQAEDGTLPWEMCQASTNRCYGDACYQAVVLPSVLSRAGGIHAVLIVGLAPRTPYDRSYQGWIKTLHLDFSNAVASVAIAEARELAKENEESIAKDKNILTKEDAMKQQEDCVTTAGVPRMLEIMGATDAGGLNCCSSEDVPRANGIIRDLRCCPKSLNVDCKSKLGDVWNTDNVPAPAPNWQALPAGLPATLPIQFRPAVKARKCVKTACVPVFDTSVGAISCTTDMDAQKKAKHAAAVKRAAAREQLHLSESRLRNLFENAPLGILIFDQDRRPSFANKTWFKMTQHPPVSAARIDVRSILFHEDLQQFDERLTSILKTGESSTFHVRLNRLWRADSDFSMQAWVQFTAFPEMADNGSIQITTTMTDISDFKFSEALQLTRLEQAVEAKRQQENFVDMVSHEIRNPLSAVMHCVDSIAHSLSEVSLLLDQCENRNAPDPYGARTADCLRNLNSSMTDAVETIMSCTMHQTRIIDDILSLSKLDSNLLEICPSVFQVKSFLRQVESTFKAEAEQAGVQLVAVADPSLNKLDIDWIDADPGRITQVLFDLVANAIKFTKDGSGDKTVTVRIGAAAWSPTALFDGLTKAVPKTGPIDPPPPEMESSADSIFLWFKVEDTGCGMDEATKARIFTQFTQDSPKTHSKYGGSGLGLFISQKLATLLGGEIGFQSQQHVGSTFAFYTRASKAPSPSPVLSTISSDKSYSTEASTPPELPRAMSTSSDTPPTTPPSSQSNILLVEDNLVNQRVLKKQLQRQGYTVHTADNGQEAFDFIKTTRHWKGSTASQPCIDVILLDVEMPIVNGIECAVMIRAAQHDGLITKHLHIIAVTANVRPEQLRLAKESGMDDAVSKPFRVKDLAAIIELLRGD